MTVLTREAAQTLLGFLVQTNNDYCESRYTANNSNEPGKLLGAQVST